LSVVYPHYLPLIQKNLPAARKALTISL